MWEVRAGPASLFPRASATLSAPRLSRPGHGIFEIDHDDFASLRRPAITRGFDPLG